MKKGLIMEGGAMRGMFTCGVLDVFMENGVTFDGAAGISAGAVFGCNFKSHQNGRAIRYNKRFCSDPRYCSLRSLIKTGNLYGVDFCYHEIPEKLDLFDSKTFAEDPTEFFVGATDIETGKIVYHKCTDGGERDLLWMRASASLPLVSKPVEVDGYVLMDGGIVDPIPYEYMESVGYDRNVMILTQPKDYVKPKDKTVPLIRLALKKYPMVAATMAVRHKIYARQMEEVARREASGEALVIRPPEPLRIGRTEKDPGELERVYRIGRREASAALDKVKDFLEE